MGSKRHGVLESVDPRAVPLPHGTEVTTRAERLAGGRRIPRGVVGRVVRARDGGYDVLVSGQGEFWYAREELTARKEGQLAFARRREGAWAALRPCTVLETVVGSTAWGLAHEGSDTDVRGVFALPLPWTLGLHAPPEDLVSADGSTSLWAYGKAVRQALRSDPNTLEMLFVPSARASDVLGEWLLAARDAFPSRALFGSFGRYALSQLDKLAQAQRLAEHQHAVLAWLREEPAPSLDAVAARLAALSPRPAPSEAEAHLAAKQYVKQLYRSLSDQGLLAANDFASLAAYARAGGGRAEAARELRPKNAYNLLRLLWLGIGWLRTGAPEFAATGARRERLLSIKRGEVPLVSVLEEARALGEELEAAREASALPEHPDFARADALLVRAGEELARRWVGREPGPWGREAPVRPEVRFEEEEGGP
jgi:hypothetical protein